MEDWKVHHNTINSSPFTLVNKKTGAVFETYSHPISAHYAAHRGAKIDNFFINKRRGSFFPLCDYDKQERVFAVEQTLNLQFTRQSYGWVIATVPGEYGNLGKWGSASYDALTAQASQFTGSTFDHRYIDYAIQKAAAKPYTEGWMPLVTLGELKETISMFKGLLPRAYDLFRRSKGKVNLAEKLGNLDLELRYGWRSLLYELQEIASTIEGLLRLQSKQKFYASKSNLAPVTRHTTLEGTWSSGWGIRWTRQIEISEETHYRGLLRGEFERPPLLNFNMPLTLWELTKLSFVVDWFVNIGQWLASTQQRLRTVKQSTGYGVMRKIRMKLTTSVRSGSLAVNIDYVTPGIASMESISLLRREREIPSLPIFYLRLDTFKTIDLLSIVRQLATKK